MQQQGDRDPDRIAFLTPHAHDGGHDPTAEPVVRQRLDMELPNLRAAVGQALSSGQGEVVVHLTVNLQDFRAHPSRLHDQRDHRRGRAPLPGHCLSGAMQAPWCRSLPASGLARLQCSHMQRLVAAATTVCAAVSGCRSRVRRPSVRRLRRVAMGIALISDTDICRRALTRAHRRRRSRRAVRRRSRGCRVGRRWCVGRAMARRP